MYEDQMVQIGDVKTHVLIAGEGEPLVWINGIIDPAETIPFISDLAKSYKVYFVESPGFGSSEKISWIREAADYNYFFRDFLDFYNLDKVNIAGHSIGGRIALEFAISHPHRVENLILLSPQGAFVEGVKVPDYFLGYEEYKLRLVWHDENRIQKLLSNNDNPDTSSVQRNEAALFNLVFEADKSGKEQNIASENTEMALARLIWERNYNPKFPTLLKYITAPTCIIWGREDKLYPLAHGVFFEENVPNSELHIVDETGHALPVEKSAECYQIIKNFLTSKVLKEV